MNRLLQLAAKGARPRASLARMMRRVCAHQFQIMHLPKLWRKPRKVGLDHSFGGSEFDDAALQPNHGSMSSVVGVQF